MLLCVKVPQILLFYTLKHLQIIYTRVKMSYLNYLKNQIKR